MTAALFSRRALRELRDAAAWIAQDNPIAAEALLQAALAAAERLRRRPQLGRVRAELAPERYRFWSLRGFPYVVVYDVAADPPHIVRVVHAARDLPAVLRNLGD